MDMPLVATIAEGGLYDTDAYVAGWEMGSLANLLSTGFVSGMSFHVRAENLRTADLLAMAYGYLLRNHGFHGGLASVEIIKAPPDL